jgi:hypothetical protein
MLDVDSRLKVEDGLQMGPVCQREEGKRGTGL